MHNFTIHGKNNLKLEVFKMKKLFAIFLLCAIFMQGLTAVYGMGDNVGEIIGYVAEIHGDIIFVSGEPLREGGVAEAAVRLGGTPVYDLRTGFRTSPHEITRDMDIRTAFRETASEPFPAVVTWLNWSDENAAVFTVIASENISTNEDGTVFLCTDGKYRMAITSDTVVICPYEGYLSPWEITPGMEFFVWVDMITASTPALVFPDKVVLID
jgi:hypothetical protein